MIRAVLSDRTSWPMPSDEVEWRLRYGRHPDVEAAEFVSAWAHILDPNVPFSQVEPQLRELRRIRKGLQE